MPERSSAVYPQQRRLPQELLDYVIDNIGDASPPSHPDPDIVETVKAMSLVCKATRDRCQKALFTGLLVHSKRQLDNLWTAMMSNRRLPSYVCHLEVNVEPGFDEIASLRCILTVCQGVKQLEISNVGCQLWWTTAGPGLRPPAPYRYPLLRYFRLKDAEIATFYMFAASFSYLSKLEHLELESTRFLWAWPEQQDMLAPRSWTKSRYNLKRLTLHGHNLKSREHAALFARGFDQVSCLDMFILDRCDYQFFCDMMQPEKGVRRLVVSVAERPEIPTSEAAAPPQLNFLSDFRQRTGGGALHTLVLKQTCEYGRLAGLIPDDEGDWPMRLLLHELNTEQLEEVVLVIDGEEGWPGFDFKAVDDALTDPARFPAFKELTVIELERDEYEEGTGPMTIMFWMEQEFPKVYKADKLSFDQIDWEEWDFI